jgi:hypothetical protein
MVQRINKHLKFKWSDHVKNVVSSCYNVLLTWQKVKHITPQITKKQIAESLVIYNDIVQLYPLPVYTLQKMIQRV